ncbi:branched-chain amino acid transporter permease [Pseudonocardia alaniniphila]|uniref:AzlD domain-containing protein n=1 Tax=Pseudonocardia alaniniphila TaxID=75291 RepID=A0ABS9TNH5_9PSEU|nr:AzlD domain-containing protein [Pseudonocardia alaniniphila]MCH6170073.1 AzlD domain-containing protein [Pseudonocardia alaniniphila]
MPETGYLIAAVLLCAAITWTLRAVPFALLAPLRESAIVPYLGATMPVGVMVILVGHTLRDVPLSAYPFGLPVGLALIATVGLHLLLRNVIISIAGGTVVNVILVSAVFTG